MALTISEIAHGLECRSEGFWVSRSTSKISYPEHGNDICFSMEESSFWFNHRNDCILAIVRSFPPQGILFDVGGGNGYVARAIQDAGFSAAIVEPGPSGARNAKKRGIACVIQSTLEDARFLPQSLPAVGLFDVIEHIQDDRAFLDQVNTLSMPDGRVYVTVPAFQWLWSREDRESGHSRRYTLKTLSRVLEASGFTLEFGTYFFSFLLPAIFFGRTIPYRLGIRTGALSVEQIRSEHRPGNSRVRSLVKLLTDHELSRLAAGHRLPWGASCLAVARKTNARLTPPSNSRG